MRVVPRSYRSSHVLLNMGFLYTFLHTNRRVIMAYNHREIEKKWQDFWESNKTFKTEEEYDKKKFYALDMFPYPSGAGLHVGRSEEHRLNSSHVAISYAVFCLKKKK